MVAIKLAVIFLVIVLGAFYVKPENWSPFAPNGMTGVLKGVSAVFFAYIGFDAISTTAEECRNPQRDLPRGMIYSLIICTVLYVLISLVLTGMVNYQQLAVGDPLAYVFGPEGVNLPLGLRNYRGQRGDRHGDGAARVPARAAAHLDGDESRWAAPADLLCDPPALQDAVVLDDRHGHRGRRPVAFHEPDRSHRSDEHRDALCLCACVRRHPDTRPVERGIPRKFKIPYFNSKYIIPALYVGIWIFFIAFRSENVANFFSATDPTDATLGAWEVIKHKIPLTIYLVLATIVAYQSFKRSLSLIPVLGLLTCGYLMTELGWTNWMRFLIWLLVGLILYFLYGRHHSKLARTFLKFRVQTPIPDPAPLTPAAPFFLMDIQYSVIPALAF